MSAAIEWNGLTPLEVASSVVFGRADVVGLERDAAESPIRALERSLLEALQRPPCGVSFSGGRDSSVLLALAAKVARREGLPQPIAITARFPAVEETTETEWQDRVVAHVGLSNWIRLSIDDEADLVGEFARPILDDGIPYPYNLHLHVPLLREMRGGSLVTGAGGDEVFAPGSRVLHVLARRTRPRRRDGTRLAATVAPQPFRRMILRREPDPSYEFSWLRPEANGSIARARVDDVLRFGLAWKGTVRERRRSRYLELATRRLSALGAQRDVAVLHPFADPAFVAALACAGGFTGFASRTAAMQQLFGELLPQDVARRPTKASFDAVLWNRHARAFVGRMQMNGRLETALRDLDLDAVVDAERLAEHWSQDSPRANSFLLLQACWIALRRRAAPEGASV